VFSGFSRLFKPRVEALGLEIGAASLKLVELSGYPPALKALAAMRPTAPRNPGGRAGGRAQRAQLKRLRELLAEARTKKRYVVSAVPNLSA
jgi:type IV pilus assembly protein PilM